MEVNNWTVDGVLNFRVPVLLKGTINKLSADYEESCFPPREAKEERVNKLPVTQQRLPSRLPSEWRQVNDLHQPRSQGPFSSPLDEAERALEKRLA